MPHLPAEQSPPSESLQRRGLSRGPKQARDTPKFGFAIERSYEKTLETWDTFFADQLKNVVPGKAYHKLVQKSGEYPERVRLKANTTGPNACRLWSADTTPLGNLRSVETAGAQITACVRPTKAWIMGPSVGVTLECAAAVICESGSTVPDIFPL